MKIYNTETFGWTSAFRGMRNAMESWDRGDSQIINGEFVIGSNDEKLAKILMKAGASDSKFLRMIHVQADVDMPRYWWSEADTYHFNTKNSCSTMHRLLNNNNPITTDMFVFCSEDKTLVDMIVGKLEELRQTYKAIQKSNIENKNEKMNHLLLRAKRILPEGFLQMRTLDTNYAELRNMYFQRKNHRLKEEWQDVFCEWIKSLPYSWLITSEE